MDDDRKAFWLIFVLIILVIVGIAYAANSLSEQSLKRRSPEINILLSPDLETKRIMLMPTHISGNLKRTSSVNWICYVYNPKEYNQTVSFTWWLGYDLDDVKMYVQFYCSLGHNFTVIPWQGALECHLSWTMLSAAPDSAIRRIESAPSPIYLDIIAEVV